MMESKSIALPLGDTPIKQYLGWIIGFEPMASRATIWRSNQLSYTHHILLVRQKGLEPLAYCLEGSCSILLSYWRTTQHRLAFSLFSKITGTLERVMGIEPTRPAWKAGILPLNYTRMSTTIYILAYYISLCQH